MTYRQSTTYGASRASHAPNTVDPQTGLTPWQLRLKNEQREVENFLLLKVQSERLVASLDAIGTETELLFKGGRGEFISAVLMPGR